MRARRTKEIARKRRGPVDMKEEREKRRKRKGWKEGKEREKERETRERALLRYINLSLFCFACVIRGWGWMRRKSGGRPPPTGEGVVLLQSTYRHPVQTTLVPHTNTYVRMYVCRHTRMFSVHPSPVHLLRSPLSLSPSSYSRRPRHRASTYNSHDGPTHARVKTSRCVFRR